MKKIFLTLLTLLIVKVSFSQKIDTVINKEIYKSYFCYKYKEPLYVSYTLYKAGGDCSRAGFHFTNDTKILTAKQSDYAASGYDEGHLANSEDFANNCVNDEMTFRFYNCLPQTPNLNRGIWKHWETEVRKESQTDSLFVVCGGIFSKKSKTIGKGVYVPDYCWKIVISFTQHKILHVMLFTNDVTNSIKKDVTLTKLRKMVGYPILLPNGY